MTIPIRTIGMISTVRNLELDMYRAIVDWDYDLRDARKRWRDDAERVTRAEAAKEPVVPRKGVI